LGDIKYALRRLANHRGFTFVAIISLALGIGGNATIFTLLNAILLRPLPLDNPETLASVYTIDPRNASPLGVSFLNYKDYRARDSVYRSGRTATADGADCERQLLLRTGRETNYGTGILA
jgi:hypothetical protein